MLQRQQSIQTKVGFRRQFIGGPRPLIVRKHWRVERLHDSFYLSIDPDLPLFFSHDQSSCTALIGLVVDARRPDASTQEIVDEISSHKEVDSLFCATFAFSGRWLCLRVGGQSSFVFSDPCGFRRCFFTHMEDEVFITSEPNLLKCVGVSSQNDDPAFLKYKSSVSFKRRELTFLGNTTGKQNCWALLPNHCLNLKSGETNRIFPRRKLQRQELGSAVENCANILQGTMRGLVRNRRLSLALTAGWDSRLLLAASKNLLRNIDLYVDRMDVLSCKAADVEIPLRICDAFGLSFEVRNSNQDPSYSFKKIMRHCTYDARFLPKTRAIYAAYLRNDARININGNGSEICRNSYNKFGKLPKKLTIEHLIHLLRCEPDDHLVETVSIWFEQIKPELNKYGYSVLDMLYWEYHMGRWGSTFPAEQDLAVEEISPFNNRLFIQNALSTDAELRRTPKYELYRSMIEYLWPGLSDIPFNPGRRATINRVGQYIPASIVSYFYLNYHL